MPGDFLDIRPLNWDEIIDDIDDYENWADPGALSGRCSCPGNDNDNDDGESEEEMQGGVKLTRTGKGTEDRKGKGKATEDGKRKGKVKVKGNSKEAELDMEC
jgi:hypothetical protein